MPDTVQDVRSENPFQVVVRGHRVAKAVTNQDVMKEAPRHITIQSPKAATKDTIPDATKVDLSILLQELPPYVLRSDPRFKQFTGYSGRTMANLDSLKQTAGVKRIMLGNTTAYERESLVRWLESRSRILCEG